jgi:hypothetical protein
MGCVTVRKVFRVLPIAHLRCSAPPPADSRPEASNFPSQVYEFNQDTSLFQPPKYPEAPKDMYYQVPPKSSKVEKPKPIFPWEEHAPRPTRVFPDEQPPSPEPEPELEPEPEPESVAAARTSSDEPDNRELARGSTSSSTTASESDPWGSYTRTNAWDAMPEIERYVQAIAQARKGKVQVIHQANPTTGTADKSSSSPPAETTRRPSMKLTDFPTEVERPSLPVTPAPRHPSFWGEERDDAGELPAAEGVPKQEDWVSDFPSYSQRKFASPASASHLTSSRILVWRCQFCGKQNPVQKLEELQKRQSEVLQTGPELKSRELPKREMPGSAVDTAADTAAVAAAATAKALSPGQPKAEDVSKDVPESGIDTAAVTAKVTANALSPAKPKSILKEPSFELGGHSGGEASSAPESVAPEVLSPDISTSA